MAVPDPPAAASHTAPAARDPADARLHTGDVGGRVVRGSAVRIGSIAITNILVAAGAVVLLRYLGVDEFGRYGTVMAIVAIVQGVTDAGLTMTGSREMVLLDGEQRRKMLSHILGLRIVLTGVGVLAAVAFAALVGYDSQLVLGTALAGVGIFLFSVQAAMLLPLSVELRNGTLGLNEVIRQVLTVGGWVLLVVIGAGLDAFFAVQIVVGIIVLAIVPLLVGRHHLVRPRWDRGELRALAATGLPVAIAGVIAVVYYRVLTVIVSLLSDDRQSGLFVSASRVFDVVSVIPLILISVVLPVMTIAARDNEVRLRYVIQRMTEVMSLAGILAGLAVAGSAETVMVVLGGEEYRDAAPVLRITALALVSIFTGAAWSPVLIATGRQKLLALASLLGLAFVVVLGFALVSPLEAVGGAIAFAVADFVLLAALFVALHRCGYAGHLDFRFLWRLLPLTALAAAIVFLPWATEVPRTVTGVAVFVLGAFALRLVPTEFLDAARAARRGAPPEGDVPVPTIVD